MNGVNAVDILAVDTSGFTTTTVLALLTLSLGFSTYSIPIIKDDDEIWGSPAERAATKTTFFRRRIYFAATTLLVLGAAVASWHANDTWTMTLGGASLASILVYTLGVHKLIGA